MKKRLLNIYTLSGLDRLFSKFSQNYSIIFMLHRFQDPSIDFTGPGAIFPEYLEKCIVYLLNNGYKIQSLPQLIQDLKRKKRLTKCIAFTVDDGYVDFKNSAFPIFKKYNIPVMVFLTTKFIDGKLMQWWDQLNYILKNTKQLDLHLDWEGKTINFRIDCAESRKRCYNFFLSQLKIILQKEREIQITKLSDQLKVKLPVSPPLKYSALTWKDVKSLSVAGIEFGAHTVTHAILGKETTHKQRKEITASVKKIEERIGIRPEIFCYPNGEASDFSEDTISILESNGILASVTTEPGYIQTLVNHRDRSFYFNIPRYSFPSNFAHFVQCVSGLELLKNAVLGRKT